MPGPREPVRGSQTPRFRVAPAYSTSAAQECIELAASAGLVLDPGQQLVLRDALGEWGGRWSAFEVGLVEPRQCGKGAILEARQLGGLFLFGERLQVHTAHQFRTTQEHFRRVRDLIDGSDDLRRQVDRIRTADGEEAVELRTRQRLRFVARSGASGRGFSGDTTYLDEAMFLNDDAMGALLPTMSARPNPQVWYTGSAGNRKTNSVVLARLRRRALAKLADSTLDPRLAYLEWSVPEDTPVSRYADPEVWAIANSALAVNRPDGSGLSEEFIRAELAAMDPAVFACERLGIGWWPSEDDQRWDVVPELTWRTRGDAEGRPSDPVAFALDAAWPDAEAGSIAVAGRGGSEVLVQVTDHRPGTSWMVDRTLELCDRHQPCAVVLDDRGPAGHLVAELERAGVKLTKPTSREVAQAAGQFLAAVTGDAPSLRHYDQPELDVALAAAQKRPLGDAWTWARRGETDISPLVAVTFAHHGLVVHGSSVPPAAPQLATAAVGTSYTGDLRDAGF